MRTLALVPYLTKIDDINERWDIVKSVGGLTHNTLTANLACLFLTEYALTLYEFDHAINPDVNKIQSLAETQDNFIEFAVKNKLDINDFKTILTEFENADISTINSGGYVLDTLLASIWSLVTTVDYEEAVLKAVNLGDDSDTTGAVTGGLAGLLYGFDSIPTNLVDGLVKHDYLIEVSDKHDEILKGIDTDK